MNVSVDSMIAAVNHMPSEPFSLNAPAMPPNPADPVSRFNIVGECPSCGAPLGTLKAAAGFNVQKTRDSVIYHVTPFIEKSRMSCSRES